MQADKSKTLRMLKTARGQLDGIIKMAEDDRYCIDISQQISATEALLRRVNRDILEAHLRHCVQDAATSQEREEKIREFISTLERIMK